MRARVLVVAHAVLFAVVVLTAPKVPVADLECEPPIEGLCLGVNNHTVLLAGRDVGPAFFPRKLFFLVNLPVVIGVGAIDYAAERPVTASEDVRRSWVYAGVWLLLGTVQWWAIGSVIQRRRLRTSSLTTSPP